MIGVRYLYYYYESGDRDNTDMLKVEASATANRGDWVEIARYEKSTGKAWNEASFTRAELAALGVKVNKSLYFRFTANDIERGNKVEAAIDAFEVIGPTCNDTPEFQLGDMNCDGSIDFDDIDPFVVAIVDQGDYESAYPDCRYLNADTNKDGAVDFDDIDSFVECLVNGGCE
jgi:hypothetical protein